MIRSSSDSIVFLDLTIQFNQFLIQSVNSFHQIGFRFGFPIESQSFESQSKEGTMVDCRSLIEFCRAFKQHRNMGNYAIGTTHNRRSKKHNHSINPLSNWFCDQSTYAAIDIMLLLTMLVTLGVLTGPSFKFIFREAYGLLPAACMLLGDVIYNAPVAYAVGLLLAFVIVIAMWEIISHKARKCGNPHCKGLRKAVEFDIQLESEECVKFMTSAPPEELYGIQGIRPLEVGQDLKELEAELKRMAPLNGRTVLIFRAPCGCPAGRMEVWGPKKIRRVKK